MSSFISFLMEIMARSGGSERWFCEEERGRMVVNYGNMSTYVCIAC